MARVPYLRDDELVEPARARVASNPIALYRALANSPGGLDAFAGIGSWIRYGSTLDPRQRELLILSVGAVTRCAYEFAHHVKIGRDFGCSDDDIRGVLQAVRGEPSALGEDEQLLVQAGRECTLDGAIGEATLARLAERYDAERLVEIVLTAAHYAAVVRVLGSLHIDVEPDFSGYLEAFPFDA